MSYQEDDAPTGEDGRTPLTFLVLVYALTIPFWLLSAKTGIELLPGLPVAAFAVVCPAAAALFLVYRRGGAVSAIALLKRSFDGKRISAKAWYIPVLFLKPAVAVAAYGVMRYAGVPLPLPQFSASEALLLFLLFFVGGLGEELGWTGYVTKPLQDRFGALRAGVLLGAVWAVWHVVPLLQAHRSWTWIAWWSLGTVATRVLMVWLYNNTGGSVFAAALFHAMDNVSWQLFPVHGSYFDPRISGVIAALLAVTVVIVWGPWTLARFRRQPLPRE